MRLRGGISGAVAGVIVLVLADAGGLEAQVVRAGDLELDFTGRAQIQLNTTSVGEEELGPGSDLPDVVFEQRRTRLGVNATYADWLFGRIEVELAPDGAELTDAYVEVPVAEGFAVRAGQFKKPYNRWFIESNTRLITVERDLRIRGVAELVGVPGETHWLLEESGLLGRDVGVALVGEGGGIGLEVGLFNGEGPGRREDDDSKAFASRVTYGFGDDLEVGGAVTVLPTGVFDGGDEVYATAWGLDAEWGGFREPGLRVMGDAMWGDDPLILTGGEPATMVGVNVAGSWFMPREGRVEGLEPLFRVSWADPDTDTAGDEGALLTPGFNVYFSGRNRLAVNTETYLPAQDGVDPQYGLVVQLQLYF